MKNAEDEASGGGSGGSFGQHDARRRAEMDKAATAEESGPNWPCSCSGKFNVRKDVRA